MTFGAFGQYAIAQLPEEYDNSVPDPFSVLLQDPEAKLIYLIELSPYNPSKASEWPGFGPVSSQAFATMGYTTAGGEEKVYLSDQGFITEPDDNPANTYFAARVDNPFQMEISILNQGNFSEQSLPSFGSMTIVNGDGEYDALQSYFWEGRAVRVKAGSPDFAYDQFATVFAGMAGTISVDDERLTITLSDNRLKLDQQLEVSQYAGTGDLEGPEDLQSTPKPLAYGELFNIEPILVDPVNLIYQIHDGGIQDVTAVRDRGVALTDGGDVADITATSVSAGHFKTQLSGGYIRLGSTPAGRITCDVEGSDDGGYVDSASDIALRIVKTKLGTRSLSDSEIDAGTFAAVENEAGGPCGLYITDSTTGKAVLDTLIRPLTAYWTFDRAGLLIAGVVDDPDMPVLSITEKDIDSEGVQLVSITPAAERINVGYKPAWTVQDANDLASGAPSDIKTFSREAFRFVSSENRAIRVQNAQFVEMTVNTLLNDIDDAEDMLERLERVYGQQRKVFRVPLKRLLFRVFIGDTVTLTYPRHGLNAGRDLLITGMSEDVETGLSVLELWG